MTNFKYIAPNTWEQTSTGKGKQRNVSQHSLPKDVFDAIGERFGSIKHMDVEDSAFDLSCKWWVVIWWGGGSCLFGCRKKADLVELAQNKVSENYDESSSHTILNREGEAFGLVIKQVGLIRQ